MKLRFAIVNQTFSRKFGLKLTLFYVQSMSEIWMEWMRLRHSF